MTMATVEPQAPALAPPTVDAFFDRLRACYPQIDCDWSQELDDDGLMTARVTFGVHTAEAASVFADYDPSTRAVAGTVTVLRELDRSRTWPRGSSVSVPVHSDVTVRTLTVLDGHMRRHRL